MAKIWDDDYRPYGINEGQKGSPGQWKRVFKKAMSLDEAIEVMQDNSPWGILGLSEEVSTFKEVQAAFRKLAFKAHPDHGGTDEAFRKVNAAYSILRDHFGRR